MTSDMNAGSVGSHSASQLERENTTRNKSGDSPSGPVGEPSPRQWFKTLGSTVALLFVLVGCPALVLVSMKAERDQMLRESQSFVDQSLPAIIAEWDVGALISRTTRAFNASHGAGEIEDAFRKLRGQLGRFKEYDGASGKMCMGRTPEGDQIKFGHYTASAAFEKGLAIVVLQVVQEDGTWRISSFLPRYGQTADVENGRKTR